MPIAMILMLSISAKDFMQPVFTEPVGRVIMTISMGLFASAYFIAEKITNIEV
jgi:tight adherence protein B